MSRLFLDIETNGTDGRTGDLLLVGAALDNWPVTVADNLDEAEIVRCLANPDIAIVSHSTFDPKWFAWGTEIRGPLYDTKVMAHTLNENTPLDLDWLVHRYVQKDMDKRLRRSSGHVLFEADNGERYDLAEWRTWKYENPFALAGEEDFRVTTETWRQFVEYNRRDVEALRELFYELEYRLEESDWTDHWLSDEVPYTRVLMDMEMRGLPIDLDAVAELTPVMEADASRLEAELLAEGGLPESFNLNSPVQLNAYLFGRVVHLTDDLRWGADAVACLKSCLDGEHEDCYSEWEVPKGATQLEHTRHIVDLLPEGFVIDIVGREVVHGHWVVKGRGLAPTPKTRNKVTGEEGKLPSTSSPELLYMHAEDPWVRKLCVQYRKTEKLLTTYLRVFPKVAKDDGTGVMRLYGSFNQTGTVTGRLSSSNPNLQNQPSRGENGRRMRTLFRFPEDDPRSLIIADYDQLEMRIMASLSGDERLGRVFREGGDPHSMLAEAIFGAVDVYAIAPGASASYRDASKQLNYAMPYGAGPRKVAQTLSLMGWPTSVDTAKGYLGEMNRVYPGIFRWVAQTKAKAVRTGSISTLGGRRRRLRAAFKDTANWKAVGYGERQAVNSRIQGTAADIIRAAMVELARELPEIPMLAQVHDELLFEATEGQLARSSPWLLQRIQTIGETAHGFDLDVPLVFKPVVAKTWADKGGHGVEDLLLEEVEDD